MPLRSLRFIIFCSFALGCAHSDYYNTQANYGDEVEALAQKHQLSAAYLKALIVLESSGRSDVTERFEKHIYLKLKKVKAGKMKMGNITASDLKNCSDQALRNLASSWGPFQLMGYHCFQLGINISDLRGKGSIRWAVKWIDDTYGPIIRDKKFEQAFRIHNSGQPDGGTTDPHYVENGLAAMEYFEQH